jgi:hypothetical protein
MCDKGKETTCGLEHPDTLTSVSQVRMVRQTG